MDLVFKPGFTETILIIWHKNREYLESMGRSVKASLTVLKTVKLSLIKNSRYALMQYKSSIATNIQPITNIHGLLV